MLTCTMTQVYKLFIIVELLMGDIPERSVFRQPVFKKSLLPYLQIVQGKFLPFMSLALRSLTHQRTSRPSWRSCSLQRSPASTPKKVFVRWNLHFDSPITSQCHQDCPSYPLSCVFAYIPERNLREAAPRQRRRSRVCMCQSNQRWRYRSKPRAREGIHEKQRRHQYICNQ